MAERNIKGTWKGKERKVTKAFSPMIGVVYNGVDKLLNRQVVGILVQMSNLSNDAVLLTKESTQVHVSIKSLEVAM
jgi:hypothetical protein